MKLEDKTPYCGYTEKNADPGQKIRDIRVRMNLTQEYISRGICSVQKISRIESGIDSPTESEFHGLMSRLQEPAIDYGDMYVPGNLNQLSMRSSLREEAVRQHWGQVATLLYDYSSSFPPETVEERQFLGFYEAIHCYIFSKSMSGYALYELCQGFVTLGRPEFLNTGSMDFVPTQTEFLLLNAMAVGLSDSGDPEFMIQSRDILRTLLVINNKRQIPTLRRQTQVGLLLNLLSLELDASDLSAAEVHLRLLFESSIYYINTCFYCQALICRYTFLMMSGENYRASQLRDAIVTLFHINPEKRNDKVLVF